MANLRPDVEEKSGKVVYNAGIVRGIVALAINEVEGAQPLSGKRSGISLYIEKDGIYADVSVIVKYGYDVPELAYRIQRSIKQNVETMTKYKVAKVDVHVQDVIFDDAPVVPESNEEPEQKENETDK
ncbi:MAG: Asp23/Gls24 family envelope stress response protein [Clostridiales bacterium]|nr:Asp23/Gls24 family envelope stress response protein [Clostridiales bacterium]